MAVQKFHQKLPRCRLSRDWLRCPLPSVGRITFAVHRVCHLKVPAKIHQTRTAAQLGITLRVLRYKLKKLRMD
ncbi:helix-turn-helix domain-containing protein [Stenotrophomonas sp.]|uniref:helix-turn-helix domain-containing protein n=1 Tax=Stenotrophomonas sp. TaxID=69392 RepID=UPI00289F8DDF|nr:helix-turn-helix domain-containing protein [Stenotrophomonas sp.]